MDLYFQDWGLQGTLEFLLGLAVFGLVVLGICGILGRIFKKQLEKLQDKFLEWFEEDDSDE